MTKILGRLLATTLVLWLTGASAARAEYMGWTYSFDDSGFTINPNAGQASGVIGVALPANGSATTTIPNVILQASTGALGTPASPADLFVNAPYFVTLTVADPAASQSHDFKFNGQLNGSATAGNFQISNTFTGGSSQDFTLGGRDYHVTAGPFSIAQATGAGSIGFAVQVSDPIGQPPPPPGPPPPGPPPPSQSSPEPTSLVLVCLALPALGWTNWKRKKSNISRS
jgi:hypothetical protein